MNFQTWLASVREKLATAAPVPASPVNGSLLLGQRDRAAESAETALCLLRAVIAEANHQRASLTRAQEDLEQLTARSPERSASLGLSRDALERTRLLALNAGLEGARLGEAAGRAVLAIADEVRAMTGRALEGLNEHAASMEELRRCHEKVVQGIQQARQATTEILEQAGRAEQAQLESRRQLGELGAELQRSLGADPEVARVAGVAATHLEGFLATVQRLPSKDQRARLIDALRPSLQPLLNVLAEETRHEPDRS